MKNPAADPRTTIRHRLSSPKRKRERPRKDEVLPPKPLTRIEQQRTRSLDEMRAGAANPM